MVVCVKMMSKGSKEALTVLIVTHVTHVKKVKSGVCGLCTQYRYIQCYVERVLIVFQSAKSFGKLRLRPFQPYHSMLCMLKHVEGVKSLNNFRPLRHT